MRFFICGSAMRGQPDHGNLGGATFVREATTAPRYRLHSVDDRHPGIYETGDGGIAISGELYELSDEQHRTLLAGEPPDLYETEVLLDDGSRASAMLYPKELIVQRGYPDVSSFGGWAAYKASKDGAKAITIDSLDHFVLTVRDIDATIAFYRDVLGMTPEPFGEGRIALKFGKQKINLHVAGREFEPKAHTALPGTADVCFLTSVPIDRVVQTLRAHAVEILEGPVRKTGAQGALQSVYVRDPDQNLIEISNLLR